VSAHPVGDGHQDPTVLELLREDRVLLIRSLSSDGLDREPRLVRHAATSEAGVGMEYNR
jgi:hypothetical protein